MGEDATVERDSERLPPPSEPAPTARPTTTKSPTIYDVARLAGVSHQTVSRHLRGLEGLRPATRKRVVQALEALDYRPNLTARNLALSRSHRIGVLTHEIGEVGPTRLLQGAGAAAREAGYLLDIVSLDTDDPAEVQEALRLVTQQDIAGLLVFASTDAMTAALRSTAVRVPMVLEAESDASAAERSDQAHRRGLRIAVDHLVELGHRRFFHIAGPALWASARNRKRSYERALAAHGLTSLGYAHGDWSAASGYQAAAAIPEDLGITAVVVSNDQMALGALRALRVRGLSVPGDVSVTGFDDTPEAAFYEPPLTSVHSDFDGQGRAAFIRLLRQIEGGADAPSRLEDVTLTERSSTGRAAR